IIWHAFAASIEGTQGTYRETIVSCKYSIHGRIKLQQFLDALFSRDFVICSALLKSGFRLNTSRFQRLAISLQALVGGCGSAWSCNGTDAAVSAGEQMLHGLFSSQHVIDENCIDRLVMDTSVHCDDGDLARFESIQHLQMFS